MKFFCLACLALSWDPVCLVFTTKGLGSTIDDSSMRIKGIPRYSAPIIVPSHMGITIPTQIHPYNFRPPGVIPMVGDTYGLYISHRIFVACANQVASIMIIMATPKVVFTGIIKTCTTTLSS